MRADIPVAQLIPNRSLGKMMSLNSIWCLTTRMGGTYVLPVEVHPGMESPKKNFLQRWWGTSAITYVCNCTSLKLKAVSIVNGTIWPSSSQSSQPPLTGHLMDETDIVSHGGDHVHKGVLLHLDRGVRDQDVGILCRAIRRQHVVDLRVHSWKVFPQKQSFQNNTLYSNQRCICKCNANLIEK